MRYAALTNLSSSLPTLEICELYLEARTIRDNMERINTHAASTH